MAHELSIEHQHLQPPSFPSHPPPLPPKEAHSPTHSASSSRSENASDKVPVGSESIPPRSSSMSLAAQARNFSRPVVERKPIPGGEPLPNQHQKPTRYHGNRKSSGVNPFPEFDATQSQSSSTPTSEAGEVSAPSGEVTQLSTPDTGSLDSVLPPSILPPSHIMPIRSGKPVAASIHTAHVAQETPILHVNEHIDDINSYFGGEPGPIIEESIESLPQLQYPTQHQPYGQTLRMEGQRSVESISRPKSMNTIASSSNSDGGNRLGHRQHLSAGGSPSPSASPMLQPQGYSHYRQSPHSPENRPISYIDLLQTPYAQQVAPAPNLDNSFLRQNVGTNASLLDSAKTLEMYRANVKKTNDSAIQYEFALFMVQTALDLPPDSRGPPSQAELLRESRQILQKLADRSYPFAQYYLADGYSSGLFNKGKEDYDRAFPLFIAAAKRGHAEAAYRAALCYEFGWGGRKDYSKAVQYYRMSASKNHPGAATRLGLACINESMGLSGKYREGVKWLKRAAESADTQYNAAPYELAKLHENGFGDDIFKDEAYAAELFSQSASLGHPDANLVMGKAYEHGLLGCPQDAALSIHFYTGAAEAGEPEAMMALCAWYLFGAEPILEKNEHEAFAWALKAAELSMWHSFRFHIVCYDILTSMQITQGPSMLSVISKKRVSVVVRILSVPTSIIGVPHNKAMNERKLEWQLSRQQPLVVPQPRPTCTSRKRAYFQSWAFSIITKYELSGHFWIGVNCIELLSVPQVNTQRTTT